MTVSSSSRTLVLAAMLMLGEQGCRDVGIVGRGTTCQESCPSSSTCMTGICVPLGGGAAGDEAEPDEHEEEEDEHEEEEEDHEREPAEEEPEP